MEDAIRALLAALGAGHEVTIILKPSAAPKASPDKKHQVKCSFCEWSKSYSRSNNAQRALRAHSEQCVGKKKSKSEYPKWLKDQTEGEI